MLPSHVPDECEICNISVLRLYNILCVKEMCTTGFANDMDVNGRVVGVL